MQNFKGSQKFYKKYQNDLKFSSKKFNSPIILSAGDFNRYLQLQDHQQLINISQKYGQDNCFCESRQNSSMINLFFDYDCKDIPQTHAQVSDTIKSLRSKIQSFLPDLNILFYVKQSDEEPDYLNSMHIITHLSTSDGHSIYFDYSNGCSQVKHFVSKLNLQHPFDHKQAYSGHLFRLIHSNKFNKDGSLSGRILYYSPLSDLNDDPLLSLSSYCPNPNFMLLSNYINKHFILQYVKNHQYTKNYLFKDIIQRPSELHLSLTLTEQRTPICTHKSNNAVCMFYNHSTNHNIIIKCQDSECGKFFQTFFHYDDDVHRCQIITTGNNSSQTYSNTQQFSNSETSQNFQKDKVMIQDISFTLNKVFLDKFGLELNGIQTIDNNYFLAIAKSPQHASSQESHELTGQEKKILFRKTQGRIETINQPKELQKALSKVSRQFNSQEISQYNVQFNQFDNSIHYHYHAAIKEEKDDTVYDDDFDDFEFKSDNHREYFINIINDEFQFVPKLYNLDFPDQFIYVYDENDRGCPMYFDNLDDLRQNQINGGFWNMQGGLQVAKQKIRDFIVKFFKNIINQIDKKDKYRKILQLKLKQIRSVIKNNNEFDQYLMETYFNKRIKFNNIPYYIHFKNGTLDLEQRQLIKTIPDMYNTFQIDYDYDESVSYNEIYEQLCQIMEKEQFDWFLKQLSNCLNPNKVIEEKQIVILVGFGNNGKTILYNLMNHTLGLQAYSTNGRSVMIQAPNTTTSNATPDLVKLQNKRFCYIAELDKNQPFNQQQIKILTGGEDIQARDLYKSFITFQPSAGIFISTNQIPYIDTTDGGFINRFKIIDLKYQFVENPSHQFQKQINRQLQNNIKSVKWKQGFINLLLVYYYKERFHVPKTIQNSIDTRINLQLNPLHQWALDNLQYSQNSFFLSEEANTKYSDDTNNKIKSKTFNNQISDFFQQYIHIYNDVLFKKKIDKIIDGNRFQGTGFFNCQLKQ